MDYRVIQGFPRRNILHGSGLGSGTKAQPVYVSIRRYDCTVGFIHDCFLVCEIDCMNYMWVVYQKTFTTEFYAQQYVFHISGSNPF